MTETATSPTQTPTPEPITRGTSAGDNAMQPGWRDGVAYPWRLRSSVDSVGNEAKKDEEEVWAQMARRARTSWIRENPY